MTPTLTLTHDIAKAKAHLVQQEVLALTGRKMPLGHCLNLLARLTNGGDWNALKSALAKRTADDALIPSDALPAAFLTNACCEAAWGDQVMFEALGLSYGSFAGQFYPLTKDEETFIAEDGLNTRFGWTYLSYTTFWNGQKWLTPVIDFCYNNGNPQDNMPYATAEEARSAARAAAQEIAARIAPVGGFVRVEADNEPFAFQVMILLPFALAKASARDYESWRTHIASLLG